MASLPCDEWQHRRYASASRDGRRISGRNQQIRSVESDDSLPTWNLLDSSLEPGAAHPLPKVMPWQTLETRPFR